MFRVVLGCLVAVLLIVCIQQRLTIRHLQEYNEELHTLHSGVTLDHARTQGWLAGLQEVYRSNLGSLFHGLNSSQQTIAALTETIEKQRHMIKSLREGQMMTITAYNAEEAQTDDSPFITANNNRVREGIIAVSPDLFKKGWTFGRKVYIVNHGVFTIDDLSAPRNKNHLDIFMNSKQRALRFGRQKLRVFLLGA